MPVIRPDDDGSDMWWPTSPALKNSSRIVDNAFRLEHLGRQIEISTFEGESTKASSTIGGTLKSYAVDEDEIIFMMDGDESKDRLIPKNLRMEISYLPDFGRVYLGAAANH